MLPHTYGNALSPKHQRHQVLAPVCSHGNSFPVGMQNVTFKDRGWEMMVCVSVWVFERERERDAGPRDGQRWTTSCFFCGEHVKLQHRPHFVETGSCNTWSFVAGFLHSAQCFQGPSVVWTGSVLHPFLRPNNIPFHGHATFHSPVYSWWTLGWFLLCGSDEKRCPECMCSRFSVGIGFLLGPQLGDHLVLRCLTLWGTTSLFLPNAPQSLVTSFSGRL